MSRRLAAVLVGVVLVAALVPSAKLAWRFRSMPQIGAYHDDAVYLASAKGLAEHAGYRVLSLPDQPFQTRFPPVFPLLLSLVWRLDPRFPENLPKVTLLCWSLLPLYAFLVFRVLRQWGLGKLESTAISALAAVSPHLVLASLMTMSDLTFCVLVLGTILLLERGMTEASPAIFAAAGVAGGLAFLTRTQGLALLASATLCLVWRRRWLDAALYSSVFGIAVAGWFLWTRQHAYPGTDPVAIYYVDYARFYQVSVHWADIPGFVQTNVDSMFMGATRLIFASVGFSTPARAFAWVVCAGAASGLVRAVRQTGRLHFALFSLMSFLMLIPSYFPPNERYMLPLWPALAVGLYFEFRHIWGLCRVNFAQPALSPRLAAAAILTAGAVVAIAIPWNNLQGIASDLPSILGDYERLSNLKRPGYEWIRDHTPVDTRILTYDDPLLYLYTGRTGYAMPILYWLTYDCTPRRTAAYFRTTTDFMAEHNLTYALVTASDFRRDLQDGGRKALTNALSDGEFFEETYSSPGTGIFKLKSEPASVATVRWGSGTWWAGVRDSIPGIH
jgi:hypothetical protein